MKTIQLEEAKELKSFMSKGIKNVLRDGYEEWRETEEDLDFGESDLSPHTFASKLIYQESLEILESNNYNLNRDVLDVILVQNGKITATWYKHGGRELIDTVINLPPFTVLSNGLVVDILED